MRSCLWKDITFALIVKMLLLTALWKVSFSDPVKEHLTVDSMRQKLLN